jgi:hypothetical protein
MNRVEPIVLEDEERLGGRVRVRLRVLKLKASVESALSYPGRWPNVAAISFRLAWMGSMDDANHAIRAVVRTRRILSIGRGPRLNAAEPGGNEPRRNRAKAA